jgi:RimJ/RimL family protein N-acetyltransferase
VILSERLVLVPMPFAVLDALLGGDRAPATELLGAAPPEWWAEESRHVFELRRDQLQSDPAELQWLLRAMVTRAEPATVVGQIGFHEPPDERGFVEVGYAVFSEFRRRGYAEEACRALYAWAAGQPRVNGVRASVAPDNGPSLALAAKFGFVQTGTQIDEIDGLELVFELPLPLPQAAER